MKMNKIAHTRIIAEAEKKGLVWIIGIDEAGRGPLAGPVSVGGFAVPVSREWFRSHKPLFEGVHDSKQVSEKRREEIYDRFRKNTECVFKVSLVSSRVIDAKGIAVAIKRGMKNVLRQLLKQIAVNPQKVLILLDGSLTAPEEFVHQQTYIKGDDRIMIIGAASIAAKVRRDRYMRMAAKKFPQYGFEIHKGYGTLAHRKAIGKSGLSQLHRTSFCSRIAK